MPQHNPTIVVIDDDTDDLEMLELAFMPYTHLIKLYYFNDGQKGLDFISHVHQQSVPCLLILDINMPRLDGKTILTKLKKNPLFKGIPVVLFTTSNHGDDVAFAHDWGAELVTKPLSYSALAKIVKGFVERCMIKLKT